MSETDRDLNEEEVARCVLMFSGGRDSSLAAVRLFRAGYEPVLVTVTSDHLIGIDKVHQRLRELKAILPAETRWLHVGQPENLFTDKMFYAKTCLPCHQAYVVVAAKIAKAVGSRRIALGYASYQSDWPEQTPLATVRLKAVLADFGMELILPAYDVPSKDEAITELKCDGLSEMSLEQKCLQQVLNVKLEPAHLAEQVSGWGMAIRDSLNNLGSITLNTKQTLMLGDF